MPCISGLVARNCLMRKSDSFRYADRTWNADLQSISPSPASIELHAAHLLPLPTSDKGLFGGSLLRRRDRTAWPLRVVHYSSSFNTFYMFKTEAMLPNKSFAAFRASSSSTSIFRTDISYFLAVLKPSHEAMSFSASVSLIGYLDIRPPVLLAVTSASNRFRLCIDDPAWL